jgi:hypothetical protein
MHPVARVSIKYWKTSVRNTVFFSARFYCALLTLLTEVFQYLIDNAWYPSDSLLVTFRATISI